MVRSLVFGLLSVLPVVSSASAVDQGEKFGYEHLHLDVGAGTTNEEWLDNSNATTVNFGGNYLFTNNWLFNVDYSAQFFHPDDFTLRIDRLLVGGGYRQGITPLFDIYGTYGVGAIKAKATNDKTDNTLSSDSELLQAVTVGVNYLLSEKLIATAEVEVNRSDIVDENNVKIGFNYQWHDVIGSGLFYQFRDTDYSGESSDYINEVGLSLKFIY
ncbi:opacity protein-like surface antigen [Vibrio sp. ES.051]|uniref:outer membrane beta-barrel protein n=1 Tax=Vibrio sp. ES.051 TaxID=1761909 RepID=UPI000BF787D8|nr:outer membrane beta-barrel protein [Vibrio sp. ES.051]PFG56429.1 opacity protein-like surface antigen [Vibrio sp. ES.051]